MRPIIPHILLIPAILLAASCGREPIRTYQVAKENRSAAAPASAGLAPTFSGITWTAPEGWTAQAPNSMRVGSYAVPNAEGAEPADFSITTFPGDVGGDLANVNRWRGQIGLPPITGAELPSELRSVAAPAGDFLVVNFRNPANSLRLVAAIFKQPDHSWFFKLTGPDALVASQQSAFDSLLQSVRFGDDLTPPPVLVANPGAGTGNTNDLPPGHPPVGIPAAPGPGADNTPATQAGSLALRWAAPDHWIAKPLGQMRKGSYTVHAADGVEADFSIISLAGDGGGFHENVNRWRGQIGLGAQDGGTIDRTVRHVDSAGLHFDVVEFAGDGTGAQRVVGAVLSTGAETWFFKLTGPDAAVAAERESFMQFIRSVRSN